MEKLRIESISQSNLGSNSYILLFRTEESNKLFPIVVGAHEAQIISCFIENLDIKRPVTHQLFLNFLDLLNYQVEKVLIHKFEEGIFFAKISFRDADQEINLDARPSDAIALAIKSNAPIFVNKNILDQVEFDEEEIKVPKSTSKSKAKLESTIDSIEELEDQLIKALESEDYELAAKIRDKMNKKNK